ncbi:nucleoside-diphosphate kinase [Pancytospora epiphaga]|nr:nucleoside-diphosphate kinase [Pancytospora epiphaga]
MERTFVMVKNDGVNRRLIGRIISRLEEKGLFLVQSKVCIPTMDILRQHYAEHVDKPFFKRMAEDMCKSQVFPMIWEGKDAVAVARKLIGATNPINADVGTIRGDFGMATGKNLVHGSDSIEAGKREIKIWFGENVEDIKYSDKEFIYE